METTSGENGMTGHHHTIYYLLKTKLSEACKLTMDMKEGLPEIIKAAYHEELQDIVIDQLKKCDAQLERFGKICERFSMDVGKFSTERENHIIERVTESMTCYDEGPLRDSSFIILLQSNNQLLISLYYTLSELCRVMGYFKISEMLFACLREEEECYGRLGHIAEDIFNEAYENSLHEELENND